MFSIFVLRYHLLSASRFCSELFLRQSLLESCLFDFLPDVHKSFTSGSDYSIKKDMTQKRLAELSGVSRATINYIKSGKSCTDEVGRKIAKGFGVRSSAADDG